MSADPKTIAENIVRNATIAPRPLPDGVILTRASSIKIEPIRWLWQDWLARGKFHLLAGAPGQGKTTIALGMAAAVSSGGRWPDGSRCEAGGVLIWSGEDDPGDTLAPRLLAMGANLDRVHFIQSARIGGELLPFDPARDMPGLCAAAEAVGGVRLLVVDPVVSAIRDDSHKNAEVRRGLQPVVDLAAAMDCAAVGITHLSKGTSGRDPTERVIGSIAFSAVARVVLLAAKVKGDDGGDRRILVRSKSNIGPDDGGFEYHVTQTEAAPGIPASVVTWGKAIEGSARELLAEAEAEPDEARTASEAAEEFLRELLTVPTPTTTIQAEAKAAGHSWATVRRAADSLQVSRKKGGMNGGWYWRLPEGAQKTPKVLIQKDEHLREKLSTFGNEAADTEVLS